MIAPKKIKFAFASKISQKKKTQKKIISELHFILIIALPLLSLKFLTKVKSRYLHIHDRFTLFCRQSITFSANLGVLFLFVRFNRLKTTLASRNFTLNM